MQTSKFDVDVNAAAAGLFSFSTAAAAPHLVNICRRSRVLIYQILSLSTTRAHASCAAEWKIKQSTRPRGLLTRPRINSRVLAHNTISLQTEQLCKKILHKLVFLYINEECSSKKSFVALSIVKKHHQFVLNFVCNHLKFLTFLSLKLLLSIY